MIEQTKQTFQSASAALSPLEKALLHHSDQAIAVFDMDMNYRNLNLIWRSSYNLGVEKDVIGKNFYDLFPSLKKQRPDWVKSIKKALKGEKILNQQDILTKNNGITEIFLYSLVPLFENQKQVGLIMMTEFIAKSREQEASALDKQKMEALGKLASGVAHEVNNFLQPILTYTQLLERLCRPNMPEKGAKYFDYIKRNIAQAAAIIENTLIFSKSDQTDTQDINLTEQMDSVLEFTTQYLPKTMGVTLHKPQGADPLIVNISLTGLQQILINLFLNARDASEEQGHITISYGLYIQTKKAHGKLDLKPGPYFYCSVGDNWPGMSKEVMAHIFEPFYTTKGLGKGTGLGLSIIFGLIKKWRGVINVESEEGKGTCFTFYIPLQNEVSA